MDFFGIINMTLLYDLITALTQSHKYTPLPPPLMENSLKRYFLYFYALPKYKNNVKCILYLATLWPWIGLIDHIRSNQIIYLFFSCRPLQIDQIKLREEK